MHFTHVRNLATIIEHGHVKSDEIVRSESIAITECAEPGIKGRRRQHDIEVAPYGTVSEYVPFYYKQRSPMMSSISKGKVPSYPEGQEPLVYLGSRLSTVDELGLPWVASNGNCASLTTEITNRWDTLETFTDWEVIQARYWANTNEDGDRKRRRMSEFMVHRRFPLAGILGIVTMTERIADQAREIVADRLPVHVRRDWYYP